MKKLLIAMMLVIGSYGFLAAQDKKFDESKVPMTADSPEKFVPAGWKLEEAIKGDLNGDGKGDYAIKIVQNVPEGIKDAVENDRVLILALADGATLKRVAVADSLLQCTSCGGAFFGSVEAPADIKIDKGVLVIDQESGSREVATTTYRFRYDEQPAMFILIGFDYAERDRATGDSWTESTNYITGKRITTIGKKLKSGPERVTYVKKMRYSLADVNHQDFAADAAHRLGVD